MSSKFQKIMRDPLGFEKVFMPKAPEPEPVKPMPINDDASNRSARRKSLMGQRRRSGRASTVLSRSESLG